MTAVMSIQDRRTWLVEHRWEMDRGESAWLKALADFDLDQGWALDGQLSAAAWIMWQTDMARATAYEKLRITHQLRRRPMLEKAFADGRLSYSAVRAITRIEDPDPEVDAALVDLAVTGLVLDVERAVRHYQLYQDQDRPPPDPSEKRGLQIHRGFDGTGRIELTVTDMEIEEVAAVIQAFLDLKAEGPSSREDNDGEDRDESPRGDFSPEWSARRADAFMEMARTALAHAGRGHAMGADRYLVHVVRRTEELETVDGTPIDAVTAAQIDCDCSSATHLVGDETLVLGRKTREWNTAQRRAILVRDRGRCRFPAAGTASPTSTTAYRGRTAAQPTWPMGSLSAIDTTGASTPGSRPSATPTTR